MSFSVTSLSTPLMSNRSDSLAISACITISSSRSPSSSRKFALSLARTAPATSYASSIKAGNNDSWVCSRSQGQPAGARSLATISQSFSNAVILSEPRSTPPVAQSKLRGVEKSRRVLFGFHYGFLDFARNDLQIRQSERCVPNSEISPEDFLLT